MAEVFINRRGQKLPYRALIPTSPVALAVFHHGIGDHCGRHLYLLEYFSKLGIAAYSYDCLGHGDADGEGGKRVYIPDYNYLVDDLVDFAQQVGVHQKN